MVTRKSMYQTTGPFEGKIRGYTFEPKQEIETRIESPELSTRVLRMMVYRKTGDKQLANRLTRQQLIALSRR